MAACLRDPRLERSCLEGCGLSRAIPEAERLVTMAVEEGEHPKLDRVVRGEPERGAAVTAGSLEVSETRQREASASERRCRVGVCGESLLGVLASPGEVPQSNADPGPAVQRPLIGRLLSQDLVEVAARPLGFSLHLPRDCSHAKRPQVPVPFLQDQRRPPHGKRRIASEDRNLAARRGRPEILTLGLVELGAVPLRLVDALLVEEDGRPELPRRSVVR